MNTTPGPPSDDRPKGAVGDLFSVDGRVAVVTGASSGLGERFARVLHAGGATVVAGARRVERLEALSGELGPRLVAVVCDVAKESDCRRLVEIAIETGDRVDVLVNNAGTGALAAAEDEPLEDWRRVIDVNLTAAFHLSQLAGRRMIEQGSGSIVNIASILAFVASSPIKEASYVASKGGIVSLTRELACQWARKGVRVNAIAPGWFRTEMAEKMFTDETSADFLRRNCPMARGGEPHELDGALLFLASDASSYVTGTTLTIDGGWTAR